MKTTGFTEVAVDGESRPITDPEVVVRATRRRFQVFVHRPEQILATAEHFGLKTTLNQAGCFWQVAALRRIAQ